MYERQRAGERVILPTSESSAPPFLTTCKLLLDPAHHLMRIILAASLFLAGMSSPALLAQSADAHLARAKRILRSTPLVDTHNDLPWAIRENATGPRSVDNMTSNAHAVTDIARLRRAL